MAKCLTSELRRRKGADAGIQILGGNGYATEYDMQRYWRDVRLLPDRPDHERDVDATSSARALGLPRSF